MGVEGGGDEIFVGVGWGGGFVGKRFGSFDYVIENQ